jgi:hypothetical protein
MINMDLYDDVGFKLSEMEKLEMLLKEKYLHWITLNPKYGIYDLVLDNQMMSDFRSCPSYFIEAYVNGISTRGRSFDLEFGLLFHSMMEDYYRRFRDPSFNIQEWGLDKAVKEWGKADMNFHSTHKTYQSIGGVMGFVGLLISYANRFSAENEHLRVIGTEISFGKNKEVLLGSIGITKPNMGSIVGSYTDSFLTLYLSGRIDTLVDDGVSICPMDHKTQSTLRYDPALRYEVDEGPTGYIYAISKILPRILGAESDKYINRNCNKIIMNFISKTPTKDERDRFKRIPILKTLEQLESYRKRMLLTGEQIFRTLVNYASTRVVNRDTSKCTNWYMHDCAFLPIHRQNSRENELMVINQFYEKRPIWDTENVK